MKALGLVILSLASGFLWHQLSTPENLYADAANIPDHEQWFSLRWQGDKVGYLKESWNREIDSYKWSQSFQIKGKARGQSFSRHSEEVLYFGLEEPYPLIRGSSVVSSEPLSEQPKEQFSFTIKDNQISVEEGTHLTVSPYPVSWDAEQLWAPQSAAADLKDSLNTQAIQFSSWDMKKLQTKALTFNFGKVNSMGEVQAISQQPGSAQNILWLFNSSGKLLSKSMGESLALLQSTRENAMQLSSKDVYLSSLLKLDKPLGLTANIGRLELELGEYSPQFSENDEIKITQRTSGGYLQIGTPGDYENGTKETFLHRNEAAPDNKRITRLATALVKNKKTVLQKVTALMNFVAEFIEDGNVLTELTLNQILDNKKGDCSEHAMLFVALSRAAGIPAREVNGLLYLGDAQQKYSAHVWAEVNINGNWISIDPTWRKINLDPGYIRVYGDNSSTVTTLLAISGKKLRVKKLNYL